MRIALIAVVAALAAGCFAVLAVAEASPGLAGTDDPGTIVAVLDTGVAAVPELRGRTLAGIDLVDGDRRPSDPNGHGTAVATAVLAACPNCTILPVRVLSANGAAPWSRVAAGIVWAVDRGARVVNVSIAGPGGSPALRSAVAYAAAKDVLVVAAAGNTGTAEPQYPAAYESVLGVAATAAGGRLSEWSSRGTWVDLAVPGCGALRVSRAAVDWACGTSFAAPVAAGTAARVRGADPAATSRAVVRRLPALVRPGAAPGAVRVSGTPRPGSVVSAAATGIDRRLGERVRWFRCAPGGSAHDCSAVSAGPTYRVASADAGWALQARVTTKPFGGLWLASSPRLAVSA